MRWEFLNSSGVGLEGTIPRAHLCFQGTFAFDAARPRTRRDSTQRSGFRRFTMPDGKKKPKAAKVEKKVEAKPAPAPEAKKAGGKKK